MQQDLEIRAMKLKGKIPIVNSKGQPNLDNVFGDDSDDLGWGGVFKETAKAEKDKFLKNAKKDNENPKDSDFKSDKVAVDEKPKDKAKQEHDKSDKGEKPKDEAEEEEKKGDFKSDQAAGDKDKAAKVVAKDKTSKTAKGKDPKPKAKAETKKIVKAKKDLSPKGAPGKDEAAVGCPKCRQQWNGCRKCNPGRF